MTDSRTGEGVSGSSSSEIRVSSGCESTVSGDWLVITGNGGSVENSMTGGWVEVSGSGGWIVDTECRGSGEKSGSGGWQEGTASGGEISGSDS